jgi:hypothetical protein
MNREISHFSLDDLATWEEKDARRRGEGNIMETARLLNQINYDPDGKRAHEIAKKIREDARRKADYQ